MLAQKALEIAVSQLGISEAPRNSNRGPQVNSYLRSVGLPPGNPWCMAFVYWCVQKACDELKLKNPLVKTGHVLTQWNKTTLRKLPKTSRAVKPGDIFIMHYGGGKGHTGFVESIKGGFITTIEGNTNDEGSREGYEVARRTRSKSSMSGFIQLP
ncbi:MAG: CHAP domain-containing protein [Chitinophagaceae bacterium]|nr:CHAP domain-containing protein [Chitinophagaceae bacterium]